MKELFSLNSYFWKYRWRLFSGIVFIFISNYFAVLAPQVTGYIIDQVQQHLPGYKVKAVTTFNDPLVVFITGWLQRFGVSFTGLVALCGIVLLLLALLRGIFMFFMRQTIIVMSRHIEFDQKNEIFRHYQRLDMQFYKTHETGDLMNRIAEDVSRVRAYTGPAIMYLINLVALISLSVFYMVKKNAGLSLYVLTPLPVLAIAIYFVNNLIHKKSEAVQAQLSDLTTVAQQSYSGIRVIKSFVQEKNMLSFFNRSSEQYRTAATDLYKTEAIYFPAMALVIGISTILVIYAGGMAYMKGEMQFGDMAAFIMYLTMLTFPVSAIGWVASTIQRAAASQKRINEFLHTVPAIPEEGTKQHMVGGEVEFKQVTFTYPHTGITALKDFNLHIRPGEKIALLGRTGSGKTSVAQLLLRFYDPNAGEVLIDGEPLKHLNIHHYRSQLSYVPQDVFLFSDSIHNNISFGNPAAGSAAVEQAAKRASIHSDILNFSSGYQTMVGERGVTLSGGQKQRISIARAIVKEPSFLILDDCLNAVDYKTEAAVLKELNEYLQNKTAIIITHRIFSLLHFDRIVVLDEGRIAETGTHESLLALGGIYTGLYKRQQAEQLKNQNVTE